VCFALGGLAASFFTSVHPNSYREILRATNKKRFPRNDLKKDTAVDPTINAFSAFMGTPKL